MTSFACFLAWVLQLPPVIRLVITSGRLLDAICAILIDPETGAIRELDARALDAVERALQTAETSISRAIWLRALQLAGLPAPRRAAPFRYLAPRNLSDTKAMAHRAAQLLDRLHRLERHARALARSMSLAAHLAPATPSESTLATCACTLRAPSGSVGIIHAHRARGPERKTGPPQAGERSVQIMI